MAQLPTLPNFGKLEKLEDLIQAFQTLLRWLQEQKTDIERKLP